MGPLSRNLGGGHRNYGVVLHREQTRHSGASGSGEVCDVRVDDIEQDPDVLGQVVAARGLWPFSKMAGRRTRRISRSSIRKLLSRITKSWLLGGRMIMLESLYGQSYVPYILSALAGAPGTGENLSSPKGTGTRSSSVEPAGRNRCDAVTA